MIGSFGARASDDWVREQASSNGEEVLTSGLGRRFRLTTFSGALQPKSFRCLDDD